MPSDRPDISLVIPAYNEAGYIGRTLRCVGEARTAYGDPSAIQTVVVDNLSTDGTAEAAIAQGARVVVEEKRYIAAVRNRGARESSGTVLAFLDADGLVSRSAFTSIRETMSTGRYVGGSTGVRLERMSPCLFVTMCLTVYPARWLFGFDGGLCFVERSVVDEVGGFDESLYCAEIQRSCSLCAGTPRGAGEASGSWSTTSRQRPLVLSTASVTGTTFATCPGSS